ncbi:MAG: hypothetical protein KAI47_18895, partial [Deltaproteobacteria bacterium]|nr:hypothetical protein [Deltaproteobacteria bacterium]
MHTIHVSRRQQRALISLSTLSLFALVSVPLGSLLLPAAGCTADVGGDASHDAGPRDHTSDAPDPRDHASDAPDPRDAPGPSERAPDLTSPPHDSGPATRTLPAWFEGNRVHAHTRLQLGQFKSWTYNGKDYTDKFAKVAPIFSALGVSVYTRHIKTGPEDPWWPSAAPKVNGQSVLQGSGDRTILLCDQSSGKQTPIVLPGNVNLAKKIIDDAHARGLRIILYHLPLADGRISSPYPCGSPKPLHPEWACHNADGSLALTGRGVVSDITTPYRDVVLQRLMELAAMGTDGFYFDGTHMPNNGCWGTALQQSFEKTSGQTLPKNLTQDQLNNELDPVYRAFLRYQAKKVEETFRYWRDTVKAAYPGVVFLISATYVPALISQI